MKKFNSAALLTPSLHESGWARAMTIEVYYHPKVPGEARELLEH